MSPCSTCSTCVSRSEIGTLVSHGALRSLRPQACMLRQRMAVTGQGVLVRGLGLGVHQGVGAAATFDSGVHIAGLQPDDVLLSVR